VDVYLSATSAISSIEARLADPEVGPKERGDLEEVRRALVELLPSIESNPRQGKFDRLGALSDELSAVVRSAATASGDDYVAKLSGLKMDLGRLVPISDGRLSESAPADGIRVSAPAPSGPARRLASFQFKGRSGAAAEVGTGATSPPLTISTILLCFYSLPFTLILISASIMLTAGQIQEGFLLNFVRTLAKDPGSYAGTLQIIIVPVAAALTSAAVRQLFDGKAAARLLVISLLGVTICILDALIFSVASALAPPEKGLVSQYFISAAGVLSVYAMLLVGLGIAKSAAPVEPIL
jgi:hypothetical protein